MTRPYGWKKQTSDSRDKLFRAPICLVGLPPEMDLRPQMPEPYDQGALGSCTANAICAALVFDRMKQKALPWDPSRLFLYYLERVAEGDPNEDNGAAIRDGAKCANNNGVCRESNWPYVVNRYADRPSPAAFGEAENFETTLYESIPDGDLNGIKSALASGFPVVFGFTVFESFESDDVEKTGIVPMPSPGEKQLGGHAVIICGYSDATQRFLVQNSWGSAWGMGGRFTIPYAYVGDTALANDFWVMQSIKDSAPAVENLSVWQRLWRKILGLG